MDFSLSQEQEMFRHSVRKFLDGHGQTNIARDFIKEEVKSFAKAFTGLADLGCTAITIPEKYEGAELGALDLVPVLEELGRALLPGLYLETVAFAAPLIEKYGTEQQRQKYLPQIATGSRTVTLAWLEPKRGYHPDEVRTSAQTLGSSLVINGTKSLVPEGETADTYLLLVRSSDGIDGAGLSLVLLDREEINAATRKQKCFDETRQLAEITFENVAISTEQLLGEINQGWSILQEGLLHVNAALCSLMVGGMDRLVEMTTEYANIRVQFGQPIGRFQAIKHRIADMKTDLETARSLSYYANWTLETNAADREAAIFSARAFVTEAYIRIASHSIQIHGGIGFTEELDCQLYLKRARYYENYLGSIQQYKERAAVALNW
ncbi:acyl-CoA dehydrogenase family protein [Neobacillus citreus]|uniref:Acyl-CoA/acyl-ACP dehydrogenase n=1 Tax=Neobacillus citreus TaxID=2833578 RepID=A0A942T0P8_9BACI|nr:acyl-CoA dehydrogenase family protein [Neobacillus citreus]MCH6267288.1 acyl-CoA/acyl-ACP dehydrogenase [Neobacillus citreus]